MSVIAEEIKGIITADQINLNGQEWHQKFATGILASPRRYALAVDRKAFSSFAREQELAGVKPGPAWRGQVRKLLPTGTTTMASVTALRETSFTNSAVVVAEEALKPQSDWTGTETQCPVVTIAHHVRLSKQLLDDLPAFRSMLQARLFYGLAVAEDLELLTGNGTLPHLTGLLQVATITPGVTPPVTAATLPADIGKALDHLLTSGYMADGIVLHPLDWSAALREKGLSTEIAFVAQREQSLWGVPISVTPAMPRGQFLVGDFAAGAQIFDREDANMLIATQDRDNFVKDLITARAEERLALAIYQAGAFRKAS